MSSIVETNVTYPGVREWAEAHDLDTANIRSEVTINDDGTITLQRYLFNDEGKRYCLPGTSDPAVEEFTITPKYPIPSFTPVR